jgi:CBS domain-containing protein
MRAKDVMTTPVLTVTPDTPVKEVARLLVERKISAVPVVDEFDGLVGIISEADLVPLEAVGDPSAHILPLREREAPVPRVAREVMTKEVITVDEEAEMALVAGLMIEHRLKSIPVVMGKEVLGIVSRRDVLRVLSRTDEEIHVELTDLLDDEIEVIGRFHAEVQDGVVTLRGPRDRDSRRLATLLARSVPGVIRVRFTEDT